MIFRYFGISDLLNEKTAAKIWKTANAKLATPAFTTQGILKKMKVKVVCTTDDPVDDLRHHRAIAASGLQTRVLPAFRADKALAVLQPELFNQWTDRLAVAAGVEIDSLGKFLDALRARHDFFHTQGCRLSDHGLNQCPADFTVLKASTQQ